MQRKPGKPPQTRPGPTCYSLRPVPPKPLLAVILVTSTAFAHEPPAGDGAAALSERLDRIEAALDRIESARVEDGPLDILRAAEIRMVVADLLADADSRTARLDEPAASGWDRGFVVRSADGNFLIRANLYLQLRFTANHRNGAAVDNDRWGVKIRRARINASGHVVDPSWTYKLSVALTSGEIRDAYIAKDLGNGYELKVGQFKLPFLREFLVSSTRQQAANRSIIASADSAGRSEAVQLSYQAERWRVAAALSNGIGATGVPALAADMRIAASARVEFAAVGDWSRFDAFTSPPGSETAVMLGAAVHHQRTDTGSPLLQDKQTVWTADVSVQLSGANLFVYVVGNHLDNRGAAPNTDRIAIVVQGGLYVAATWEVFARYEWADPDIAGESDLSVITAGVTRFIHGRNVRWTTDVGVGLKPVAPTFASGSADWLADVPGHDGQVVVRSQLQLVF